MQFVLLTVFLRMFIWDFFFNANFFQKTNTQMKMSLLQIIEGQTEISQGRQNILMEKERNLFYLLSFPSVHLGCFSTPFVQKAPFHFVN